MAKKRSPGLVLAGYFLARCTQSDDAKKGLPPPQLGTDHWGKAYVGFYRELGEDRGVESFSNSLKNVRDAFDGYFEGGRTGWRSQTSQREPMPLTEPLRAVFDHWSPLSDDELWAEVSQM